MKSIKYVFIAILVILIVSGCSGKPITFKSVNPLSYADVKNEVRVVTGEASGFQLLLFIPIVTNTRHDRAYQQLLDRANGGYVTNIRVKESWTYAFVGTVYTTTITADVYPRK